MADCVTAGAHLQFYSPWGSGSIDFGGQVQSISVRTAHSSWASGASTFGLARSKSTTPARRDVARRGARRLLGLTMTGAFLVDGSCGDLHGLVDAVPAFAQRLLDVVLLTLRVLLHASCGTCRLHGSRSTWVVD